MYCVDSCSILCKTELYSNTKIRFLVSARCSDWISDVMREKELIRSASVVIEATYAARTRAGIDG
eukprot:IDg1410t1